MSKNEKFHQDSDFELNDDALKSVAGGNFYGGTPPKEAVCTRCGTHFEGTTRCPICNPTIIKNPATYP